MMRESTFATIFPVPGTRPSPGRRPTAGRGARALACLALLAAPVAAQEPASGSESHVATASNQPAAAGESTSETHAVASEVGHPTAGPLATSANYRFESGAVLTGAGFSVPPLSRPVVFGVSDAHGTKAGGNLRTVFGFNFDVPNSFLTTVDFGSAAAAGIRVVDNTTIELTTPPGVSAIGNSFGAVDVAVTNLFGAAQADAAYVYEQGIYASDPPTLGQRFNLHLVTDTPALFFTVLGISQSGVSLPLTGFEGRFELVINPVSLPPTGLSLDGFGSYSLTIPPDPTLLGLPVEFQMLLLETINPTTGAWTNVQKSTIQ